MDLIISATAMAWDLTVITSDERSFPRCPASAWRCQNGPDCRPRPAESGAPRAPDRLRAHDLFLNPRCRKLVLDRENGSRFVALARTQDRGREVRLVRRVRIVLGFQGEAVALPVLTVARSVKRS